jgi:hypothetical protein
MAPYFLTHHGLIRARLGEPADGIGRLTEAIEIGDRHGEVHYHAETLRHRGLLRLADAATDDPTPGLADLTAAAQLACEQEAPLYAARAFCDLVDAGGTPSAGLLASLDGCLRQLHPNSSRVEVVRAVELLRDHAGAR